MKTLRVLLIAPPSFAVEDDRLDPPLGLLYLAAVLRERGLSSVRVLDFSGTGKSDEPIPSADVYGLTCFCTNYVEAKDLINRIRASNASAFIALGGPNSSAIPDFTLQDSRVDAVFVGEGEDSFADAIERLAKGDLSKGVIRGQGREDIDSYPFPARDLVDLSSYTRRIDNHPALSLLASRGCAYRCAHCNSIVMNGTNAGVRYRSADNIIKEISDFRNRYSYFRFSDGQPATRLSLI